MRFSALVLVACAFGALSVRATELISLPAMEPDKIALPVLDPPKSDAKRGDYVFNLLPRSLQQNPEYEMSIMCRVTPYGQTFLTPSPKEPVYYIMEDAGQLSLGETRDREKPPEHLDNILIRALSINGYRPATDPTHQPELLLIYRWGSHYALDLESQIESPLLHHQQRIERAQLIGNRDYFRQYSGSLTDQSLYYQEQNSLFFTIVSAYDHASVARGKPELVWRANLTANAQGVSMSEALPALVLTASTSFGRDTKGTQFVTRRGRRGQVELGPLIFEPDEAPAPAAPVSAK